MVIRKLVRTLVKDILSIKFLKFSIVGLVGVGVNEGMIFLLTEHLKIYYAISGIISFEIALLNNFFLNDLWTFKNDKVSTSRLIRLLKFHISRILSFIVTVSMLILLTEFLNLHYLLSNLIAIGLGTLINYITSDLWVWK